MNTITTDTKPSRRWSSRVAASASAMGAIALLALSPQRASAADPDLLYSARSSAYTGSGNWPLAESADAGITALTPMGSPGTSTINGQNWVTNKHDGDGFKYTNVPQPGTLSFNGGSIVVAARPIRYSPGNAYQCLVSNLLSQFSLLVQRDTGQLSVWRKGTRYNGPNIPNGQITIFSVVVQPDGQFKVYLNGDPTPVMNITDQSTFSNLTASQWYMTDVSVGKGWNGDGWSSFNGDIGDVYVYKVAIDDGKRETLEDALVSKYGSAPVYTITASAGAGGSISPAGAVVVPQAAPQNFVITPDKYFDVATVMAGPTGGAANVATGPDAQTYTYPGVAAAGSITASFTEWSLTNIAGKVTSDGTTGVAGVTIKATGGREPYTTTTASDGTYTIRVKPGVGYTLTASARGYSALPASLSAGPADLTGKNFVATWVGNQKLIDLKVDSGFTNDATLTSWPNTGTLGGQFVADGAYDTTAPTTRGNIGGRKAVQFDNNKMILRATGAPNDRIMAPPAITGANSNFTVIAKLYSDGNGLYDPWEQFFLAWSRRDGPAGSCASFGYGKGWWGAIGGWGYGDTNYGELYPGKDRTVAPAWGQWNTVAMTSDGATVKVYYNGTLVNTQSKSLAFHDNMEFSLGSQYWGGGEGRANPLKGSMSSLEVWTLPMSDLEIAEASGLLVISGKVTLPDNATPIAGAVVSCPPYGDTTTAANGTYGFIVDAGTYSVSVANKLGYAAAIPATRSVSLTTVSVHDVNFTMQSVPTYTISGKVTLSDNTTPVVGATVGASTGGETITATTGVDGTYSIAATNATYTVTAVKAYYSAAAPQSVTVASAPRPNVNLVIDPRNIPAASDLLFAALTDDLPASGPTGNWATYRPTGGSLTALNNPAAETIGGVKWEKNLYTAGNGYRFGSFADPVPVNGASIVAVVKPQYYNDGGWGSVVNIFMNDLRLDVDQRTGRVTVVRKGKSYSGPIIVEGEKAVLSAIVQPTGEVALYVNGVRAINSAETSSYLQMTPGNWGGDGNIQSQSWAHAINVGRNDPDGWSIYNGNIGDVFVYKKALQPADRMALEDDLAAKFGITFPLTFTINTTATNGSVSPAGPFEVVQGKDATFNFIGSAGYVDVVKVDGVVQAGNPTSYTFSNVQANHSLDVTFTVEPAPANDNFAGAINLPGDSGTQSGTSNFAATFETGEPDINGETKTVWFKWTAAADGNFTVSTDGSTTPANTEWDAILAIYKGTTVNALTVVQTPKDTVLSETVTLPVTAGTTYYIQLAGYTGGGSDVAANLVIGWSFVVPPPANPFGDWAGFYFTPGSPESAMDMDPDNDGRNNLQEYAFDEDPTKGSNSGHMRTTIEDVGGQQALLLTVAVIDSAVFTGSPSLTATAGGVVYTIQGGNDLSGFNQTVTEVTPARSTGMPAPFAGWVYRTFRLSGPISANPAGFLRIRTAPAP